MRWTTDTIRQSFLDFFKERGHLIVPSAPLVPHGDPTLLFTNAGMVQFKDYFLGVRMPPSTRVADCQKCLRISGKHNDLEAVGRDTYHHTFFEMLGNWSFGDYYKEEAIRWHWELLTKVWGIDPKLLYATVHKDDDEAEQIWLKLGVLPRERIMRFGDKENFWEMGATGPCGPNSEIDIDRGPAACDGKPHAGENCGVNVDGCERFIELGNLVFIQYNRDESGKLTPLPKKHVDTGTGLERVAAVLQGFEQGKLLGNYDIDLFQTIIARLNQISASSALGGSGVSYGDDADTDVSFRAIADHARAACFLAAEGITPGNTDREYVLRRLIRRMIRHGRRLGIRSPFLSPVKDAVIEAMGDAYGELLQNEGKIDFAFEREWDLFSGTLDRGLELLKAEVYRRQMDYINSGIPAGLPNVRVRAIQAIRLAEVKAGTAKLTLPGEVAFKLYDTYGFPLDLTQDICRESNIEVDVAEFDRRMEEQRERSRSWRGIEEAEKEFFEVAGPELFSNIPSRFIGDHKYEAESTVLAHAGATDRVAVVTAETPFYPQGGGQVGDRGVIETDTGAVIEVEDARRAGSSIVHTGRFLHGDFTELSRGARVTLKVDRSRRDAAMLNHSATHILHYALRDVLGTGVRQAGSLVAPDRLRFDFSHTGAIAERDLQTIEEEINARIREDAAVTTDDMAYDDAIKAGALAFFGDKYGDRVRVVRMGDFSVELCGGTHVDRTGQIGIFKLDGESGVAAGVRRIEATTGQGALDDIRRREAILAKIGDALRARDEAALERLQRILAHEKELEKKLRALEQKLASGDARGGAADGEQIRDIAGIKLVTRKLDGVEPHAMREMADRIRQKHGSVVVALGSNLGDKAAILVAVTADLTAKVKAGDIIKQIAPIVGGSGGGRPDLAQAGGRDPSRLDEALAKVASLLS